MDTSCERNGNAWFLAAAGLLTLAAFGPSIGRLVEAWIKRPEYSHGFLMPPLAVWLLWRQRGRIRRLEPAGTILGVLPLLLGLALLSIAEMKLFPFMAPFGLVLVILGILLSSYGPRALRVFGPALLVLLLMCPIPARMQTALTLPLKNVAAVLATGFLDVTGVHATLQGNQINLPNLPGLFVADACSGIRSLISLLSLSVVACILWDRRWWKRILVVLSTVPIAVLGNSLRIWVTGYLSVKVGPEAAKDAFHLLEGFLLFAVGAALVFVWAWALDRAFPERS